jgi:Cys-tRNA(Pro) deacylase
MGFPAATERVMGAAAERGLTLQIRSYPAGTKTAADAAAAIGCDVAAIVKSLVFVVDDEAVVALIPGDLRLDPEKLARALGGSRARRADLEEVRAATGYAAGGTPPFGHATDVPVLADEQLMRYGEVWAAAGTPTTVFPIAPRDLVTAAGARWADLTPSAASGG